MERGFRWLGPEVPNANTKTFWECEQGHRWEAPYGDIQQGYGCLICAGKAPKTPVDYHTLAKERGFRWLGPEVPNSKTRTFWECEQGHQWEANFNNILKGYGCPYCYGNVQKKPTDYHVLAKGRGFRWLGPEVPNVDTPTTWECEQGHQWEARYDSIQRGGGCPECIDMVQGARVSQIQRDLCEMLQGELNRRVGRYNIDVALNVNGVAIAIEYDSWFWHGHRQDDDAKRDKELLTDGWRVLRIKSNAQLPTREQIDSAIARLLAYERQTEIVLDDWGKGPTRFEAG